MGVIKGKNKACLRCGAEFWCVPSREKKGGKYCSPACHRIAKQGSLDLAEAFWMKVDKSAGPDGCWIYTGFIKWDGYGWLARKIDGKGRWMTSHRYAWMLTYGEPEAGKSIMHACDVPACCNPKHLKLGTHADNMADMAAKGRAGGRGKKTILWPDRVRPVKEAA